MKAIVLKPFTMGNQVFVKDQEVDLEDWRAHRLSGEGLVSIAEAQDAPAPVHAPQESKHVPAETPPAAPESPARPAPARGGKSRRRKT